MKYLIGKIYYRLDRNRMLKGSKYEALLISSIFVNFNLITLSIIISYLATFNFNLLGSKIIWIITPLMLYLIYFSKSKLNDCVKYSKKYNSKINNIFCIIYLLGSVIFFYVTIYSLSFGVFKSIVNL